MPTRTYWAGWTRLWAVTSKTKYERNNNPTNSGRYLSERLTDWYGSATSINETPRAALSSVLTAVLVPSARTPRAMKGTNHSPVNPCKETVRLIGTKLPSKPGLGQSPSISTCDVLP